MRTSSPASKTVVPQTVVGMYHASRPYLKQTKCLIRKILNQTYFTKKSTTNGAPIEPMCDIVEHIPSAVLRIAVENSSVVCNVTIEKTAYTQHRPNIAIEIMRLLYSANTH